MEAKQPTNKQQKISLFVSQFFFALLVYSICLPPRWWCVYVYFRWLVWMHFLARFLSQFSSSYSLFLYLATYLCLSLSNDVSFCFLLSLSHFFAVRSEGGSEYCRPREIGRGREGDCSVSRRFQAHFLPAWESERLSE